MKKFLISTLILMTSLFAKSQNGGQNFENKVIRISYIGYDSGVHLFKVCNKQNCEARIRTKADQDPAVDVLVPANDCITVHVLRSTPTPILFRVKAETSCPSFTNPDMGWLEINTGLIALSLDETKYEHTRERRNMSVTLDQNRYLKVETGNDLTYDLKVEIISMNGTQMFYHKSKLHKSTNIDIGYSVRGFMIVRVLVQNTIPHVFTLKIVK